ncbi:MAG: hypothetical protein DMG68_00685 [Acidobacteria bacterium]|nr:MAG: hypothetical protein DMG68_00685 [Acidobacteriota bacterium]
MRANRPLLLGHRGARATNSIPENTFASFDLALEQGCDGFEFDVRLTADGRELICHDPEYHGIQVVRAKAHQLQGIPTLPAVIERYRQRAFLDIELKVAGLEKRTCEIVGAYLPEKGYVISSFLPGVLRELHAMSGAMQLGLICERRDQLALWDKLPLTHLMPHHKLLTESLAIEVHGAGMQLFVWTVNKSDDMRRFADWGLDGIISDETALLVGTLKTEGRPGNVKSP